MSSTFQACKWNLPAATLKTSLVAPKAVSDLKWTKAVYLKECMYLLIVNSSNAVFLLLYSYTTKTVSSSFSNAVFLLLREHNRYC